MNQKINAFVKNDILKSIKIFIKIKLEQNSQLSINHLNIGKIKDNLSMSFSDFLNCYDLEFQNDMYFLIMSWIINNLDSVKSSTLNHFLENAENNFIVSSYTEMLINHLYSNENDFIERFLDIDDLSLNQLIELNNIIELEVEKNTI